MAHNKQEIDKDLDGKVLYISQPLYKSEKLTIRTLVLEVFDGNYASPCPFTFKNGRMDCLKDVKVGDWVNIQYRPSGWQGKGEGEPRYFAENIGMNVIKG